MSLIARLLRIRIRILSVPTEPTLLYRLDLPYLSPCHSQNSATRWHAAIVGRPRAHQGLVLGCGLASSRKKREVGWRLQGAPAACRLASAHTPLTPAVILGLRGRDVDPCGAETVPEPVMLQPFWQRYKYRRYPVSSTLRVPQAIQATCSRIRVPSPIHPCTPNSILHPAFRPSDSHHPGMISVRRITDPSGGDIDAIVEVLVAAFREDVGMASASANSPRLQADMHRRTIQGCIAHGQVHVGVVNGRIRGVVAATSPGADWHFYQQEDFMRSLSPYLSEWYSYHYIPTYEELYRAAFRSGERARKEAWHVKLLAVHPDAQRQGLGRQMLSSICTQADSNGKRIVTDVKSPYHVRWFRESGFSHRSVKNFTAKDSAGFPLWCMAREPSPPE